MSPLPRLQIRNARKQFPGVLALDGVSLQLGAGEIVAVVGENGAGKSTLMKILAGIYQPDAGELEYEGRPVRFDGPAAAMASSIHLIHQELNLAENLSVTDNLFLGRELTSLGAIRFRNRSAMEAEGRRLLETVGLPPELAKRTVEDLPPGEKQLVEIARAIGGNAKVLIFDEPTSSLTQKETDRLFLTIDNLKAAGVSMLYISHRLAEVKRCADRVVVLRDGKNAGELAKEEIFHDAMVRLMVGRTMTNYYPRTERPDNTPTLLEFRELRHGSSKPVSFSLKRGEILGMSGLVGAGRTELAEAIFGVRPIIGGEILLDGQPLAIRRPKDAIDHGILLVPEDRRAHGLILDETIGFNLSLPNLDTLSGALGLNRRAERELHARTMANLRVKAPSAAKAVGLLSGGNQQKVVYGKWLARDPKVLILDEPTRGVDVGAKAEIYSLIDDLANRGVAIWMITSDMEELLGMSDRVLVMHEGRIAGEVPRSKLTEEAVMTLATGGTLP
jgi:ribose transport system ATP-binding protein